jgi:hypothetical protein
MTSRPDFGERWPARLVETAAEDRLNIPRKSAHVVCGGDCRTIEVYGDGDVLIRPQRGLKNISWCSCPRRIAVTSI